MAKDTIQQDDEIGGFDKVGYFITDSGKLVPVHRKTQESYSAFMRDELAKGSRVTSK